MMTGALYFGQILGVQPSLKSNSSSAGCENSLPPSRGNRRSKEPTIVPSPKPGSSIPNHRISHFNNIGRYGAFGTATGHGMDNPVGARHSIPFQTGSGAHPAYCTMDIVSIS